MGRESDARGKLPGAQPVAVGVDPLSASGRRRRQWQVENRDSLPDAASSTDGDDFFPLVQVDALHRDGHPEHRRFERHRQVVVDHGVQPRDLFGIVVAVDDCLRDELVEPRLAPLRNACGFTA